MKLLIDIPIFRFRIRTTATSKVELFVIIVNGFQPLTIITKSSTLDVAAVQDPPLILLRFSKTLLQHPAKSTPNPLANKLNRLACMISGKNQEQQIFQQRALRSSSRVGVLRQLEDMTTTLGNGKYFVVKGVLISFQHL